jgi:O-antigen/teichoic acid export membrane protein
MYSACANQILKLLLFLKVPKHLRLTKEFLWLVSGQAVALLGTFYLIHVVSVKLPPEQYGYLGLALTLFTLFTQLTGGGIAASAGRYYTKAVAEDSTYFYFLACRKLLFFGTIFIVSTTAIVIVVYASLFSTNQVLLIGSIGVYAAFNCYYSVYINIINSQRNRRLYVTWIIGEQGCRLLFTLISLHLFEPSGSAVVLANVATLMLIVFIQRLTLFNLEFPVKSLTDSKQLSYYWTQTLWSYGWPIALAGIFNWGYFASQRWALEIFGTTADVGKYYLLTQIGSAPILMLGAVCLTFVVPMLYGSNSNEGIQKELDARAVSLTWRLALLASILLIFTVTIIYAFPIQLLVKFIPEAYHEVIFYLPHMAIFSGLLVISQLLGIILSIRLQPRTILLRDISVNFTAALLQIFGCFLGGLQGLIYFSIVASGFHLLCQIIIIRVWSK